MEHRDVRKLEDQADCSNRLFGVTTRCAVLGLFAFASCSGGNGRALAAAPIELAEPIRIDLHPSDRPILDVQFDGLQPRRFLVDTGSQSSLVAAACVRDLGLVARPHATSFQIRGSTAQEREVRDYVRVETLAVGALTVRDCRIAIVDDAAVAVAGIDGILGQDLMARITTVFDMHQRAVYFLPGTGDDAVRAWLTKTKIANGDWAIADVIHDPNPTAYVPVAGLAAAMALTVDTGAQRTHLPKEALAAMKAVRKGSSPSEGIGGRRELATYRVDQFDLYGLKIGLDVTEAQLESGLLGIDVLGRLVFVMDGPARRMWMHLRG